MSVKRKVRVSVAASLRPTRRAQLQGLMTRPPSPGEAHAAPAPAPVRGDPQLAGVETGREEGIGPFAVAVAGPHHRRPSADVEDPRVARTAVGGEGEST